MDTVLSGRNTMLRRWWTQGLAIGVFASLVAGIAACGAGSAFPAPNEPAVPGQPTAPSISSTADESVAAGQTYSYAIEANDVNGDTLSYSILFGPPTATIDAAGLLTWQPLETDTGDHAFTISVTDNVFSTEQSWMLTVGPPELPTGATVVDLGKPPLGDLMVSDLVEFDGKIWMIASDMPLQDTNGARIYTYDPVTEQFELVLDASSGGGTYFTQGGFLRAKVIGGRLFVPDSDPGQVFIFDSASAPPMVTDVPDGAVHCFDCIDINGEAYVSAGCLPTFLGGTIAYDAPCGLFHFDSTLGEWELVNAGPYGRLRYMAWYSGALFCGWSFPPFPPGSGAPPPPSDCDLVIATPDNGSVIQFDFEVIPGTWTALTVQEVDNNLYLCFVDKSTLEVKCGCYRNGDINTFHPLTGLDAGGTTPVLYDFVKHSDGFIYAVGSLRAGVGGTTWSTVVGSADGVAFQTVASATGPNANAFSSDLLKVVGGSAGGSVDGGPSIVSIGGKLYCGSGINGHLYRIDW